MGLSLRVAQAFEPGGPLAAGTQAYQTRPGQLAMAEAVAQTLDSGGLLVVEAGTGVGKTYAYLVPALLCGERVLISTATKALQDQLFGRDIPRLVRVLGLALRVAMLKGRASYLCTHRMAQARQDLRLADEQDLQLLGRVEHWSLGTQTGDLAELPFLEDASTLLPWVSSTRENCLGARCPEAGQCFVNRARREAMAADLVVVNHHLFFADLNVRESGVAELLPSVRAVIFDESHQLNEVGVQFLGRQFSSGQIGNFSSDLARVSLTHARGFAPWAALCLELEQSGEELKRWFGPLGPALKLDWAQLPHSAESADRWQSACRRVLLAFQACEEALKQVAEVSPELENLQLRAAALRDQLARFAEDTPSGYVRWLELGTQVRMVESPLDISQAMQERVFPTPDAAGQKSWIFTSATLGHDPALSWFVQSCGLQGARILQVESPFDYAAQAHLYVPEDFPKPAEAGHSGAVAALALQGAVALGGRTLVLTTTLRAMREIGLAMRRNRPADASLEILIQGERSKRELLQRFAQSHGDAHGAVLVACASFWEGIDIPGDALQLLVIDKLPFAPPDDPLQQARARQMEAQGKSAFKGLHLPHAAVALKQGAGRLIRRESDRGVLVVCDVRLVRMGYGRSLLASLPPMRRVQDFSEFLSALSALAPAEGLTRPSTRDPF